MSCWRYWIGLLALIPFMLGNPASGTARPDVKYVPGDGLMTVFGSSGKIVRASGDARVEFRRRFPSGWSSGADDTTPPSDLTIDDPSSEVFRRSTGSLDVIYSYQEANPDSVTVTITNGTETARYFIDDSGYAGDDSPRTVSLDLGNPDSGSLTGESSYDIIVAVDDASDNSTSASGSDLLIVDDTAPELSPATGNGGKTEVRLAFSEGVFTNSDGTGFLRPEDLVYQDNNGSGAAGIVSIDHDPGSREATVTLDSGLSRTDIGGDVIEPASAQIFDAAGNAASVGTVIEDPEAPADPVATDGNVISSSNESRYTVHVLLADDHEAGDIAVRLNDGVNSVMASVAVGAEGDLDSESDTVAITGIDVSSLSDGENHISVTARITDYGSNVNPSGYTAETLTSKDTQAPVISSISLDATADYDLVLTLGSSEALGADPADLQVTIDGPQTADLYSLTRSDFSESSNRDGTFTYTLTGTYAYGDGDGTYTAAVTTAADPVGNDRADGSTSDTYVNDTRPPSISDVSLDAQNGTQIVFSFTTDEILGTDSADVAVSMDGPQRSDVVQFSRSDFSETDNGDGTYTYALSSEAYFNDGDGVYEAIIDQARDSAGNDGASDSTSDTYTLDGTALAIGGGSVESSNEYIDVRFTEGVYASNSGTEPLTVQDLSVILSANGGSATGVTVDRLTDPEGDELIGGESTIRMHISLENGPASGAEEVEVVPSGPSEIFDGLGERLDTTETTGTMVLHDQKAPVVTDLAFGTRDGGEITFRFDSDEPLGDRSSDLEVAVVGPAGMERFGFDRGSFGESRSGGMWGYVLQETARYCSGDGSYHAQVSAARDTAGNDGAGEGVVTSFEADVAPFIYEFSMEAVGEGLEVRIETDQRLGDSAEALQVGIRQSDASTVEATLSRGEFEERSNGDGRWRYTAVYSEKQDQEGRYTAELEVIQDPAGHDRQACDQGSSRTTSVTINPAEQYRVHPNYPNPAADETTLSFDLPVPANVSITFYNTVGGRVLYLPEKQLAAGKGRTVTVDLSGLASGMYLYLIESRWNGEVSLDKGKVTVIR